MGKTEPRIFTPPLRDLTPDTSLGFACIAYATDVLHKTLYPWQKWALIHLMEIIGDLGGKWKFRFRTVLILISRQNGKTVLCRAEDADRYTSLEAVNRPEVRVMENPGGLNEKFARENLPDATLIIHDINQEIPGLVASGEADVMITEVMEAGYYVGQDSRLAAPLIYEPFTEGQLGMLMPKGSEDLLEYVNQFLADEKKNGRLDELAEEFIYRYITTEEEQRPAA